MKRFALCLAIPVSLLAIFTLMPTGASSDEVLDGHRATTTFARSSAAYLMYLSQFQTVSETNRDTKFANSIGEQISQLAIALCEDVGNGGNISYSAQDERTVGQFRYSTSSVSDYASSTALRESIEAMLANPAEERNISCCAFATFCWDVLLTGHSPFGTGCTTTIRDNFQNLIKGDGTTAYIEATAKPGDLLFYTQTASTTPPEAANGNYKHAELFIGPYSGVDALGASYEIEYACAGSNQPTLRRDACIKPLSTTVSGSSHPYVYLVSLADWIASGNTPVDNVDNVEIVDLLSGGN